MARLAPWALVALLALPLVPTAAADGPAPELPRHGDVPATFSVALPLVGDAGSYERSIVRFDGEAVAPAGGPRRQESFRVEPPRDHYGADGRPHRVNDVHAWMSEGSGTDVDLHHFIDAADGRLVAVRQLETGEDHYTERTWFPGGWTPLCGLQSALQSAVPLEVGGSGTVLFGHACRRPFLARDGGERAAFVPVRADAWGPHTAVGFQQVGTPLVLLVWFTPSIPYPVRMLEQLDDGETPRFALLDLTSFTRGTAPVAGPGDLPKGKPLAPVRVAPHHGVGADETGVTHPFPWSEAWRVASADAEVQEFLDAHPDAVVRASVYNEWVTNATTATLEQGTHADGWYFTLDDGRLARRFAVQRQQHSVAVVLPAGRVPAETWQEDVVTEVEALQAGFDPAAMDRPLPDVASATRWWQAFASPHFQERGANGWMHFLACACEESAHSTAAGYLRGDVADGGSHWEASFLHLGEDGRPIVLNENIHDAAYGVPPNLAPRLALARAAPLARIVEEALGDQVVLEEMDALLGFQPVLGTGDGQDTRLVVAEQAAAAPAPAGLTPQQVALVAVGAAGLVGLGWLAKAGAAALFSRLRRDRVLDQPVRRQVMEAIEADPGIHLSRLLGVTGKGAGTVRHHVAKLVEAGLVEARHAGGYLCYFPKGARSAEQAAAPALKADGARRVLEGLDGQAMGVRPLATLVGLAPSTVEHHLARLLAAGLVRREGLAYVRTAQGESAAALA